MTLQRRLIFSLAISLIIPIALGMMFPPHVTASEMLSCQPPAQLYATAVYCWTATARAAQSGQPTTTATATVAPTFTTVPTLRPTEVQPTPPPLLIDSDGNPWACNQQASWTAVDSGRRWFVLDCVRPPVQPTPTRLPTVTPLP